MLLEGATLLHLDPARVEVADVRIIDGQIAEIGPLADNAPADEPRVDLRGRWLMPGLTIAHHHLYSALACGMPMPDATPPTFTALLEQIWWRLDRALDRDSVRVSALVGGLQALRAGVTTIVDHHASPHFIEGSLETIDGALASLGLRRILCYETTDRGTPAQFQAGLEAHRGLLAQQNSERAVLIGAHANFTLSDDSLRAIGQLARDAGVGVHIHVAEAVDDLVSVGEPLIARLQRTGAMPAGSILAHCIHLSEDELAQIGDAGCYLTHQPRSNMNNDVGRAQLAHFPASATLGTDGIGGDLLAELQAGWFRAAEEGSPWSPDRWREALCVAHQLAGSKLGITLGKLAPGAAADLAVLDPIPGPPLNADSLAAALIFRFNSSAVRDVMIGGQWRLRDRQPVGVDCGALDREAQASASALWQRMRALD